MLLFNINQIVEHTLIQSFISVIYLNYSVLLKILFYDISYSSIHPRVSNFFFFFLVLITFQISFLYIDYFLYQLISSLKGVHLYKLFVQAH